MAVGGLAARAHGASRPLVDLDFYVPEVRLRDVARGAAGHVVRGPSRVRAGPWDLEVLVLERAGCRIELGGAESARIRERADGRFVPAGVDLGRAVERKPFGVRLPVMPVDELVAYKRRLRRDVDLFDLGDLEGGKPRDLGDAVERAWAWREPLHRAEEVDAYRLFHGHAEGEPALVIDRLGPVATVELERGSGIDVRSVARRLLALHPFDAVVARERAGSPGGAPARSARVFEGGGVDRTVALEHGVRFVLDPLAAHNPGLYLDARPARDFVREHARDRRILDLFAHTGAFGVTAAAAGAASVMHVEEQKRKHDRIRANHAANESRVDDRDLVAEDAYRFLRRAQRRAERFDGVVLDPPPFAPGRAGTPGQDLATLAPLAASVVRPGGWLLCLLHRLDAARRVLEEDVVRLVPGSREIARGTSDLDFPELDPFAKLRFVALSIDPRGKEAACPEE